MHGIFLKKIKAQYSVLVMYIYESAILDANFKQIRRDDIGAH